jgi:hypothetical protein
MVLTCLLGNFLSHNPKTFLPDLNVNQRVGMIAMMTWTITTVIQTATELESIWEQVPLAQGKRKTRTNIEGAEHLIKKAAATNTKNPWAARAMKLRPMTRVSVRER